MWGFNNLSLQDGRCTGGRSVLEVCEDARSISSLLHLGPLLACMWGSFKEHEMSAAQIVAATLECHAPQLSSIQPHEMCDLKFC